MPDNLLLIVIPVALVAATLGWLAAQVRAQRRIGELTTLLEAERKDHGEELAGLETTFVALASQALRQNNQAFLQLAHESLKQFQLQARNDLDQKEKAVENLVKPIREALEKTERQVRLMENERKEAYGQLHKHLETMQDAHRLLHSETRNLVQALRRPEVRGQWGELTLRRLVELAGMVEHCDFYEQEQVGSGAGALRPDLVVRLPGGREIVVDVKTPLDAYLSAVEAPDDSTRASHLDRHARKLRERVKELAAKSYWNQFPNAPDFVVLFIPGEQFLSAALERDPTLLEEALGQKVILATPTSLVALLRAVAYGWRQEALAANAEEIRVAGEELYARLATFTDHLTNIGGGLESAVKHFNRAVGSFESKLLPGARRFTELGISERKPLTPPTPVETGVREPVADNEREPKR